MYKQLVLFYFTCTVSFGLYSQVGFERAFDSLTFFSPVEMQPSIDGSDRIFVVQQGGTIVVFPNDENTPNSSLKTFLDVRDIADFASGGERGLLGLAFHPDYTNNGYFYIYYTTDSDLPNVTTRIEIARCKVSDSDPDVAIRDSVTVIFGIDKNQNNGNHNGGKIAFGPDGYLYVSIGDGGGAGDPEDNAEDLGVFFGKILRIDVDLDGDNPVAPNQFDLYEIPSSNPLVNKSGLDEIYAWGIRNTWKFAFDFPSGLCIGGDVGQGRYEEVNIIEKGKSYGWDTYEGNTFYPSNNPVTDFNQGDTVFPAHVYNHNQGDRSITGGYVYRGNNIQSTDPDIAGKYIFGDYLSGRVWAMDINTFETEFLFQTNGQQITSFGLDQAGEMYFTALDNHIYRLTDGSTPPVGQAVDGDGCWSGLADGTNGIVNALEVAPDFSVYVGGDFTSVDNGMSAIDIAKYNVDGSWDNLGTGSNGEILAIAVINNDTIYAGGSFSMIGGIQANNIAYWNGTQWSALGQGTNAPVAVIEVDAQGNIYVGGTFSTAGGMAANNVAFYDGSWSALIDQSTSVNGTNNELRSMDIDTDGSLLCGGNFDEAGGKTANRIARWDGTNWSSVGIGTSGFVQSIVATSTEIYAGGNFVSAGNETVNRIAKFVKSSQTWEGLENGLSGNVNAMAKLDDRIIVAGSFQIAFNENQAIIVDNIAMWDEVNGWQGCGETVGTDGPINALAARKLLVFSGGNFTDAGGGSVENMDAWRLKCCPLQAETDQNGERILFSDGNIVASEVLNMRVCTSGNLINVMADQMANNFQTEILPDTLPSKSNFVGVVQFTLADISRLTCVYGSPSQTCDLLNPCGNMVVNNDIPMANGAFIESADRLDLSGAVFQNNMVFIRAQQEIRMQELFEVQQGGQLTARIGPCSE